MTVLRKSTVRPWPSVSRPSSSTCSSTLKTSRVRLLDLVEQHDRVRPAAHGLGELAALLVADVARRRADQPRDGVLLHVLATCRGGPSRPRRRTGTRPARGPARSCRRRSGPRKMKRADRPVAGPAGRRGRGARRSTTAAIASSWPTTRSLQPLLHLAAASASRPPASARRGCRSTCETTSAMSSASTSSLQHLLRSSAAAPGWSFCVLRAASRARAACRSGARRPCSRSPCALRPRSIWRAACSMLLPWSRGSRWMRRLLVLPVRLQARASAP